MFVTPEVTIIMPNHNKANFIRETIDCVKNQTISNWELILVDDASTDNSVEVISSYVSSDERIKFTINKENRGANYCRNYGIDNSRGKYVIFVDSDDLLLKTCLETRIRIIKESNLDFVVFGLATFYNKHGDSKSVWLPKSENALIRFLRHDLPWQTMQPIWKKDFLIKIGGFDIEFKRLQDVDFHTRALLVDDVSFAVKPEIIDCFYRIEEGRHHFNRFNMMRNWVYSAVAYFQKYNALLLGTGMEKQLVGTIHKTFLQLMYHYKVKELSKEQFHLLKNELFSSEVATKLTKKAMRLFVLSEKVNLLPFRIVGFNRIIQFILTF